MRRKMSLLVAGLGCLLRKQGWVTILIEEMDSSRLMIYMQQVEEENLRDREELENKKGKRGNEFEQEKSNVNQ